MNNWLTHPFEELNGLKHQLDETLKSWTSSLSHPTTQPTDWGWKPRMDVCENKGFYKIILELPGFQRDDIDVQINGRFLSIKGSKPDSKEGEWKFHRRERYSGGEFHRAVALPEGVDGSSIQAKFQGGMLTLTIPKTGGKNTQHITLLGNEEHVSRRYVVEAEERERRRRMEENDPMLSRGSYIAGRMGTVIDEERERSRRINEIERGYALHSSENRSHSKKLELQERDRRMRDHKGEELRKKQASKIARLIKQAGPVGQRLRLHHASSGFKPIHQLEERERQDRIKDKRGQEASKNIAKKVSNMIKTSGGKQRLNRVPSGHFRNNNNNNNSYSYHPSGKNSFHKNTSKFAQIRVHPHIEPFHGKKSMLATHQMEEKERNRRLSDKKGQMDAKKNAKRISDMVKRNASGSRGFWISSAQPSFTTKSFTSHHVTKSTLSNNNAKLNSLRHTHNLEEKERNRRLSDKKGQMDCKKNCNKIASMIKKEGSRSNLHHFNTYSRRIIINTSGFSTGMTMKNTKSLEEKERQRRLTDKKGQMDAKKNCNKIANMIKREGGRANLHHGTSDVSKINAIKHLNNLEEKERTRRLADKKGQTDAKRHAKKLSDIVKKSSGISGLKVNHDKVDKFNDTRQLDLIEEKERARRVKDKKGQVDAKKLANLISHMVKESGGKSHLNSHPLSAAKKEYNKDTSKYLSQLEEKERERRLKDTKGQADAKKTAKKISHMIGRAAS